MFHNRKFNLLIVCAAAWALTSSAFAVEIVHFDQDFTDGSIADEVGHVAAGTYGDSAAALGLRTQAAWRSPGGDTYYGLDGATAFDSDGSYTTHKEFYADLVNTPVLQSGNVWVYDFSTITDMAGTGNQFIGGGQGQISVEWRWDGAHGGWASQAAAVDGGDGQGGMIITGGYPDGSDPSVQPTSLGNTLADAGLPTALNSVLRTKMVQQPLAAGATRINTQVLNGNTVVGSTGRDSGGASSFKSDYTGQLLIQYWNGHGDSANVTYSAGHGGGADVPFVAATHEDLEWGLTHLTFKQVSKADNNTDGNVNLSDASTLIANWQGTGKNFFQGDSDGDGDVDLSDASAMIGAWTAAVAAQPLEENNKAATVSLGTGAAYYDPSNGHVLLDVNHVALWQLDSAGGQFIGQPTDLNPGPAVRWTITGTTKQADQFVIGEFVGGENAISFTSHFDGDLEEWIYDGVPGDLGALMQAGLTDLSQYSFSYQTTGNQLVTISLQVIPEPATAGLVVLALAGLATRLRRRGV